MSVGQRKSCDERVERHDQTSDYRSGAMLLSMRKRKLVTRSAIYYAPVVHTAGVLCGERETNKDGRRYDSFITRALF